MRLRTLTFSQRRVVHTPSMPPYLPIHRVTHPACLPTYLQTGVNPVYMPPWVYNQVVYTRVVASLGV